MDIYVLASKSSVWSNSITVTGPDGDIRADFRRPTRPFLGIVTVAVAVSGWLITFVALLSACVNFGGGLQLAVDHGSILAFIAMIIVVAVCFALPYSVAFVIANLLYPRFWFAFWNSSTPAELVLSVREMPTSVVGAFSVRDHRGVVMALIDRDLRANCYSVTNSAGKVVMILTTEEVPARRRVGMFLRGLALFRKVYSRKQMGHGAFLGSHPRLVYLRPSANPSISQSRIGFLDSMDRYVTISISDSEISTHERSLALVLGAIVLCG